MAKKKTPRGSDQTATATLIVNHQSGHMESKDEIQEMLANYLKVTRAYQDNVEPVDLFPPPELSPEEKALGELLESLPWFVKAGKTSPDPLYKYVLMPGGITFNRDKKHYIFTADQLALLYGVPLSSCKVLDLSRSETRNHVDEPDHVYLAPRPDANFDLKKVHSFAKVKVPKRILKLVGSK